MTDQGFSGNIGNTTATSTIPNYWNTDTAGESGSNTRINASGLTTDVLRMSTSSSLIYRQWSEDDWDFGSESEYPVLKTHSG